MAAPAGEGGATARALRAESRTPPSALMERPGLPRRGGARSDTGPGGAGWRGWAGRWLLSSAAPAPLNTPRPTWRTLNLDWPPLSANPSATAIPTLHRAGARAQRRPGGSARSAGTEERGHGSAGGLRAQPSPAGMGGGGGLLLARSRCLLLSACSAGEGNRRSGGVTGFGRYRTSPHKHTYTHTRTSLR